MPTFSGKLPDWLIWKEKATTILGHNQWLAFANHGTVTEDPESQAIKNDLYWSILQAVTFWQVQHRVKIQESSAFGNQNGNGAWQSLIDWFETHESNKLIALSIERAINAITYTDADAHTIGGVIDRFNGLIYEHTKYVGTVLYPADRQLRIFTMAITGEKKFNHPGYFLHLKVDSGISPGTTSYQRGSIKPS